MSSVFRYFKLSLPLSNLGQTRKVKIQDMSVATLKAMLKFIYSNVLDDEGTDFSSLVIRPV